MDVTALFNLSYGMYAVAAKDGERDVGCIANSVIQVSSSPATLAISLNKNNYTATCIQKSGRFTISVLSENVQEGIIGTFGFSSSKDKDKFAGMDYITTESGIAVLNKSSCAYIAGRVINQMDCFSHTVFIAEITDAQNLSDEHPMTYEYYHKVIKGKAPKNAPTYVADITDNGKAYTCDICGHVFDGTAEEFEALPDAYVCPVCTAPKSCFSLKS